MTTPEPAKVTRTRCADGEVIILGGPSTDVDPDQEFRVDSQAAIGLLRSLARELLKAHPLQARRVLEAAIEGAGHAPGRPGLILPGGRS